MESLKWRNWFAFISIAAAIVVVTPNFTNLTDKWWPSQKKINYGLDIQGGLHLVMGVDIPGVLAESSTRLVSSLRSEMQRENVTFTDVKAVNPSAGEFQVDVASADQKASVLGFIEKLYPTTMQVMSETDTQIMMKYFDAYLLDYKDRVLSQAIETIRNRIDEFGVAEPNISKQGEDRIIIQLPGMADAERAKQLINTAAKLEFMMVKNDKSPAELQAMITEVETAGNYKFEGMKYSEYIKRINEDLSAKLPEKTMIVFEKAAGAANMDVGRLPFLVSTDTGLGGNDLDDAFVSFDQYGAPEVSLVFNAFGANKFSDLTKNSVGQMMAVVLDKVVKSAPNINTHITGGRAVITLGGARDRQSQLDEAKMISTSLRAGALPASLEQLEERRVGPSLGADSVKKAEMAGLLGALIIFIFMVARYKAVGVISDISLALNIIIMLAMLTALGATLTLPGIAGIALTVGFAVDANVLINERIREEILKGTSFKLAVKEGYSKAATAIIDSNLTSAATAVVLLYFGTGPVRGFAVTLLIGIFTTLFANVFLSRVIVDNLMFKFGKQKLSV